MSDSLPVSKQEYALRLERTQEVMAEQGLDGLVILARHQQGTGDLFYLTNHQPPARCSSAYVLPGQGPGLLLVSGDIGHEFIVNVDSVRSGTDLIQELVTAVEGYGGKGRAWAMVGMDSISARTYVDITRSLPSIDWLDAAALIAGQRLVKSNKETALLENAARIGALGLSAGFKAATPGASQHGVELAIRGACLRAGAARVAGLTIASGPRLSRLPYLPTSTASLKAGDLVSLTVSGWSSGYAFDLARAAFVGQATTEQVDYLAHLSEATDWMWSRMLPGARLTYYPAESRDRWIEPEAHGIGLQRVEGPWVGTRRAFVPQAGMVLCVAPVIDSEEFGQAAVKQMVAIEDSGPRLLDSE